MSFSFQWCKGPEHVDIQMIANGVVLGFIPLWMVTCCPSFGVKLDPALRDDMVLQCYMIYDFQCEALGFQEIHV